MCGVLICSQLVDPTVSSTSDNDQDSLDVVLQNITSLAVFKTFPTSDIIRGKSDTMLGSVTSQNPRILRVSNGRKVNGVLESDQASLRLELVKAKDCLAHFTCQVRGVDGQGRVIINSASLSHQTAKSSYEKSPLPSSMNLQSVMFLQQSVGQSVSDLGKSVKEDLKSIIDRIVQQEITFIDRMNDLENRLEDKIYEVQKDIGSKVDALGKQYVGNISAPQKELILKRISVKDTLDDRLDIFEKRIESIVATKLSQLNSKTKTGISNGVNVIKEMECDEQAGVLKNVSERFHMTLTNASSLLVSLDTSLDRLLAASPANMVSVKNNIESIHDLLTSGEVVSQCVLKDTVGVMNKNRPTAGNKDETFDPNFVQSLNCERDMGRDGNKSLPHYMMTSHCFLKRQVLCDTKTDGGGWIVIQRRTKGDVNFNRDWDSYKAGFGNMDPDGDFWLGNQAIHMLTTVPHELQVELEVGGKDYFARYKTFRLEGEYYEFVIRLGAVTSSIDDGKSGLSHVNNMKFSTFDNDNDRSSTNCALNLKSGWWYGSCGRSQLNTYWDESKGGITNAWYNGSAWMFPTRTEMKIRAL